MNSDPIKTDQDRPAEPQSIVELVCLRQAGQKLVSLLDLLAFAERKMRQAHSDSVASDVTNQMSVEAAEACADAMAVLPAIAMGIQSLARRQDRDEGEQEKIPRIALNLAEIDGVAADSDVVRGHARADIVRNVKRIRELLGIPE